MSIPADNDLVGLVGDLPAALITFNPYEARTAAAIFNRLFPADQHSPDATEIGVVTYLDRALAGAYAAQVEAYRVGLAKIDQLARARCGSSFCECDAAQQDALLSELEQGVLPGWHTPAPHEFFALLRAHLQEGLFADPAYGGNRDKQGWRFLGHPGFWFENTAEENLASEPVTKGGAFQSLADVGFSLGGGPREPVDIPGYDPQRGGEPPAGPTDVVLVGVGAAGAQAARILARAGLKVVGFEAGPYRTNRDFVPDELGSTYYCRGSMGPKFLSETPRWRLNEHSPAKEAVFTLGRMMNSVGGSVIHWGAALRRCHPHHFRFLSHVREQGGTKLLPEGHTLVDWPISYHELEPYYSDVEYQIGVAGNERNPFVPRSQPYPMPPVRPFRMGELFRQATEGMGLHPYPTPVAVNSVPYNGFPAITYCAWSGGFGPFNNERWYPGLTWVPEALATGNFDLRTHCRVVRVLTGSDGRARGVEYLDANGTVQVQPARTVILCSYTFENVRLLLLSGDSKRPDGLGNNTGQVGKHLMTKMWSDVSGYFPDTIFNAHTGPAAQMWSLDDFIAADFDYGAHGFVGGATPNVENQRLPIQISRETLPPDLQRWGKPYKEHLRQWQQIAAVRLQPDALPYQANYLDLDPRYRDKSGLGLPLVRITYDLQPNEHRAAAFMEEQAEQILRAMGASKTWRGQRIGGVVSSHELGGCRMGEDPAGAVVNADLRVHDTPGLYVFGTAVFPTCHGVNPTLTMFALCQRAAEQLAERLRTGTED